MAIASQFFPARNEVDTASTGLSSHTQVMVPAYSGQGRNQGKDAFGWPEPWQHPHGYFQVSKHSKAMNSFQANMLRDVPDMLCFQKQLNHAMQLIESSAVVFMHFSCKIIDNSIPPPRVPSFTDLRQILCPCKEALKRGLPCGGGDKRL